MALILRKETEDINKYNLKEDYKNLLMAIQAIPGINVQSTNLYKTFEELNKWNGLLIFLHVEESCIYKQEGLFFLARSIDRRYWEHGNKWKIELEVGDVNYENGDRPITYFIFRPFQDGDTEQTLFEECKSLVDNMNHHLNHDIFMSGYNMHKEGYYLVDEVAIERRFKLEDLGL